MASSLFPEPRVFVLGEDGELFYYQEDGDVRVLKGKCKLADFTSIIPYQQVCSITQSHLASFPISFVPL